MRDVLLYEEILKKYSDDLVVKQLVTQERNHVLNQLNSALQSELTSAKSVWVKPDGHQVKITSDRQLNALFQSTFNEAFSECPVIPKRARQPSQAFNKRQYLPQGTGRSVVPTRHGT